MEARIIVTTEVQLKQLIVDAIEKAIKINHSTSSAEPNPFGDFKWLVATCAGIPPSTLRIKSAAGKIPGMVKFGKRVLYKKKDVLNWLESLSCQHTSSDTELEQAAEEQINQQLAMKRRGAL